MKKSFVLKKEILTVALVAVVSLALAAAVMLIQLRGEGKTAVIKQDGREIYRIDLLSVKEPYEIKITDGCEMVICIESGRIRVGSSSCPDKICVETGWLTQSGDTSVCLPNKVSVHIE